ncbi:LysR family transcriptional regulator [Ferrimonas sediminicola]|uniref:LysR family transcriptional regulator n=1 Tax=Ferrimonas sediminicola TaxID=2569538 RepID=A0A4U1BG52_9GAMM|nr:LysR family transcriptional regulator [Ferrimonas sediminicola]TKB48991.1 LysR family transcriptional regulator [Ferrimonas sediminicola]
MKLQLEAVRAFVAAADEGSFTAAGRQLNKTQAAISQQVQNLEIDLGFHLFCRQGKYPKLTDKGQRLLKDARMMLSQVEHFSEQARSLEGVAEPRLRIGIDPLVGTPGLIATLSDFSRQFPQVELYLVQQNSQSLLRQLGDGRLDAVLGLFPKADLVDYTGVDAFPIASHWVASPRLADALGAPLTYTNLSRSRLLLPTNLPEPSMRKMADMLQVWQVEDLNTLLSFCREGIGISCLPDFVIRQDMALGRLIRIQFDFDRISKFEWRATLLWPNGHRFHEAGLWLLNQMTLEAGRRPAHQS